MIAAAVILLGLNAVVDTFAIFHLFDRVRQLEADADLHHGYAWHRRRRS